MVSTYSGSLPFPLPFSPKEGASANDPLAFVREHIVPLRAALLQTGAVLLRGFRIDEPSTFAAVASEIGGPLDRGYQGPSPRTNVTEGVYTASEVPGALVIPEHAEMSYLPTMPRHLFFWCRQPATQGGGTTLVDGRRVRAQLDKERIAPLLEGPLRIRRRHAAPGSRRDPFELKDWAQLFGTRDREEALEHARAHGFQPSFERDGALTLENTQPAQRTHPETGELAWLNHLLVFHASTPTALLKSAWRRERVLRAAALHPVAALYRQLFARLSRDVASDVRLANGAAIPDETVAHIRAVVDREAVVLDWQRGDLVIVDNHLALHGRRPFSGPRAIAAAWSEARA